MEASDALAYVAWVLHGKAANHVGPISWPGTHIPPEHLDQRAVELLSFYTIIRLERNPIQQQPRVQNFPTGFHCSLCLGSGQEEPGRVQSAKMKATALQGPSQEAEHVKVSRILEMHVGYTRSTECCPELL